MGILGRKEGAGAGAMAFQVKTTKRIVSINQCQNHSLTCGEIPSKKNFFWLSLRGTGPDLDIKNNLQIRRTGRVVLLLKLNQYFLGVGEEFKNWLKNSDFLGNFNWFPTIFGHGFVSAIELAVEVWFFKCWGYTPLNSWNYCV